MCRYINLFKGYKQETITKKIFYKRIGLSILPARKGRSSFFHDREKYGFSRKKLWIQMGKDPHMIPILFKFSEIHRIKDISEIHREKDISEIQN